MDLIVFDIDGTLVDSRAMILAAMTRAWAAEGLTPPPDAATLAIVGLSLPVAMARLAPDLPAARCDRLVAAYRAAFAGLRQGGHAPLFPGVQAVLATLSARPGTVLGVATGKSRRGLVPLLAAHGLDGRFATVQVADDHPSKPDPAMLRAALAETGARRAVMVGDTTFDIAMAQAAGVPAVGVSWGYHAPDDLRAAGAAAVIDRIDTLPGTIEAVWGAR